MAPESPLPSDQPSDRSPDPAPDPGPRSRRSLLAAALAGAAGLVAGRLGSPDQAAAAPGSPLYIGQLNDASYAQTILQSYATGASFTLKTTATATGSTGIFGHSASTDQYRTRGVYGLAVGPNSDGVAGVQDAAWSGTGAAVRATGGQNTGLVATSTATLGTAVIGSAPGTTGWGVYGEATAASGNAYGVVGYSHSSWALAAGVRARADGPNSNALYAEHTATTGASYGAYISTSSPSGYGIYVRNTAGGTALRVDGNASMSANLYVAGYVTKAGGSFKIDHPLDPANKYLLHSFVESPDMLNVYNGNVELDGRGEATVEMPAWFEALNSDFRYQLTPLGSYSPLYVKAEIADGRFTIAGGSAGQRVSWQVTGIRQDAWAEAHRIPVEVKKTGQEKGRYLHPKEHGKPESKGIANVKTKGVVAPPMKKLMATERPGASQ